MIEQSTAEHVMTASVSEIPWYAYTLLSILPLIVGCLMAVVLTTYWKKIHRDRLSIETRYKTAFAVGFFSGCFCQYGLQEMGEFLLNIPMLTIKATIVTGVMVAIFNPMVYDVLKDTARDKGWSGIYGFLLVEDRRKRPRKEGTTFDINNREPTINDPTTFSRDITENRWNKKDSEK